MFLIFQNSNFHTKSTMQEKQAFCGTEEISAKLDISGALLLSQGQDSAGKWPWVRANACCVLLGPETRQSGDMTV